MSLIHEASDFLDLLHEKFCELALAGEFDGNRPRAVRCVHPLVTILEKLDALHRRFPGDRSPATFVRHYEDAARIIAAKATLPPLTDYLDVRALAEEMLSQRQLSTMPSADDPSITPLATSRWDAVREAHAATGPMFWGERTSIDDACEAIRDWLASEFG